MSGIYSPYKEACLDSSAPNVLTSDMHLFLIDGADYTIDLTLHDFLDDVPVAARVAESGNLTGKSITGGVFDAADMAPAFSTVTGDPCEYVLLVQATGVDATSRLICIWTAGTGLPVSPNGGDINVTFDNGASKIYKL